MSTLQISPSCTARLVELARTGSAAEFRNELAKAGPAALNEAVDTFYKPDRERPDANHALQQLQELKKSVVDYQQRNLDETRTNIRASETRASAIRADQDPEIHTGRGGVTEIRDSVPLFAERRDTQLLVDGKIPHGIRSLEPEAVLVRNPEWAPLSGMAKFAGELSNVLGPYTAAVLLPGPASASMLSILSTQREAFESNATSNSSASSVSHSSGLGVSLLGVGGFKADTVAEERSSSGSHAVYEKTTADREIIPVLTELRDRLERAYVAPAAHGSMTARQDGEERVLHQTWYGAEKSTLVDWANPYFPQFRPLTTYVTQPDHVEVPLQSTNLT